MRLRELRRLRAQVQEIADEVRAENPDLAAGDLREIVEQILRTVLADRPLMLAIALLMLDLILPAD